MFAWTKDELEHGDLPPYDLIQLTLAEMAGTRRQEPAAPLSPQVPQKVR